MKKYMSRWLSAITLLLAVTLPGLATTAHAQTLVLNTESSYLAKLAELGYSTFQEGFEDDAVWGSVRSSFSVTNSAPSITSSGVTWSSNHPATNEITTGGGPAYTGLWGFYDPGHGYATGTPTECDVDIPPPQCLFKDGFTGTRQSGETTLYGVGGYFSGIAQPNLVMILDGGTPIGLGFVPVGDFQFFGVIDTTGFTTFRVEETDGKVGQERLVFGDDFTFGTTPSGTTPSQGRMFLDDDTAIFLPNAAAWTESTFFPTTYGQGYHWARRNGSILLAGPYLRMVTSSNLDLSGGGRDNTSGSQWQAHLRWSTHSNRCSNVRVEVWNFTANTLVTATTVNMRIQTQAFNWNPVGGTFTAVPGNRYELRVYANNTIVPGGAVNCITTVDGGAFFQQTTDSSDTFNLTAFSTIDEAGLDFDQTPTATSVASISTCTSRTILKQVTVSVPDSTSSSYVVCRATGRTLHSQIAKWVLYSIDDATGTGSDVFAYTGVATTTSTYNNVDPYAMQKVYSYGSEGGSFTYYLKACRQDTATTGTAYHDDFVCEMFPTRY